MYVNVASDVGGPELLPFEGEFQNLSHEKKGAMGLMFWMCC